MEGTQEILSGMLDILKRQQEEINELKKATRSDGEPSKSDTLKEKEVSPLMKGYLEDQQKIATKALNR